MENPVKNICLVDDDKIFITIAEFHLKNKWPEAELVVFDKASEAIDFLSENTPSLLFLDINMPQYTGWELLEQVIDKNKLEKCTVFMLTSSINPEDREKAKSIVQIKDFIEKPLDHIKVGSLDF